MNEAGGGEGLGDLVFPTLSGSSMTEDRTMFGKDKSRNDVAVMAPPARNGSTPPPMPAVESGPVESVFAAALSIKGDVNFEGAIRIEGEIHGRITGQGRLTISPTGRVIGDIMSAEATIQRGWALAEQGQGQAGLAQIRQGLNDLSTTGTELNVSHLIMLAEASGSVGQIQEGL